MFIFGFENIKYTITFLTPEILVNAMYAFGIVRKNENIDQLYSISYTLALISLGWKKFIQN